MLTCKNRNYTRFVRRRRSNFSQTHNQRPTSYVGTPLGVAAPKRRKTQKHFHWHTIFWVWPSACQITPSAALVLYTRAPLTRHYFSGGVLTCGNYIAPQSQTNAWQLHCLPETHYPQAHHALRHPGRSGSQFLQTGWRPVCPWPQ